MLFIFVDARSRFHRAFTLSAALALAIESWAEEPAQLFVYDPVEQTSTPANRPITATDGKWHKANYGSFTFEAFAKPSETLETRPRDFLPVICARIGDGSLAVGIARSPAPHSYDWWQAQVRTDKTSRPIVIARNRYKGLSMVRNSTHTRHLAITCDVDTGTIAFYLDYQLQAAMALENLPKWEQTHVDIGQGFDSKIFKDFQGHIRNTRFTHGVLDAGDFLRLTDTPLSDVSFAEEAMPALPSDYGHVDVRRHYGAIGDGIHDDTAAINRAFRENENRVPNEYKTVYFPEGTYRITDSIRFSRFMIVRGAGPDRTKIVLDDEAVGFGDSAVPKPAFAVGYDWPYVGRTKRQRAGNVIGNYVFDLAIETGRKNDGVLGLDFHSNNLGAVENVRITSPDGGGLVGLDLKRGWPGPCLIKNVSIDGFDVGIDASHREYSLVFSGVSLKNQREVAIRNAGNTLSIENLVSDNRVPALESSNGGLVTLINSRLTSEGCNAPAISSTNASLYLRNVDVAGYPTSYVDERVPKDGPPTILGESSAALIDEYVSGPEDHAFPTEEAGSLKLPIKPTPTLTRPAITRWTNVRHFQNLVVNGDWAPAIQAAIDERNPVVYFPSDENYAIASDVLIRGNVQTFFGGSQKVHVSNGWKPPEDDAKSTKHSEVPNDGPAFRFDAAVTTFEFDMLNTDRVVHDTATDLIFKHCRVNQLDAEPGCGDLFIEDSGGKWRFNSHQRVWGRQMNPETKGIPEIINDGGHLWVLGLKTEYLSTKIINRGGARTEVLGGLMYPVHAVTDETLPMFINVESDISLVHAVSVYKKNHKIYMRDTQHGDTREHTDWHWLGGRPISNLYRSERSGAAE